MGGISVLVVLGLFMSFYALYLFLIFISIFYLVENYRSGLTQVGPNFVGFANYAKLFQDGEIWIYFKNTMIMWVMGFVPRSWFPCSSVHGFPTRASVLRDRDFLRP